MDQWVLSCLLLRDLNLGFELELAAGAPGRAQRKLGLEFLIGCKVDLEFDVLCLSVATFVAVWLTKLNLIG